MTFLLLAGGIALIILWQSCIEPGVRIKKKPNQFCCTAGCSNDEPKQ